MEQSESENKRPGATVFGNTRAIIVNYNGVEDSDSGVKVPWIVSDRYCGGICFTSDPVDAISGYLSQVTHNNSVVLFVGRL